MLFELRIKDFILIDDVTIEFSEGLNILTGETGAGKSMVLGAIDLVLGGNANRNDVRIGSEKAFTEAHFYTNDKINAYLSELNVPIDPDILIVYREIHAKGKSLTRINGQVVTLALLKQIMAHMIQIHGQNENLDLFYKSNQLDLLDAFIGHKIKPLLSTLKDQYEIYMHTKEALTELESKNTKKDEQIDFLTYQINEIESVALKIDEDEILESRFDYLSHLDTIAMTYQNVLDLILGDANDLNSFVSSLSKVTTALKNQSKWDENSSVFGERLEEVRFLLEDISMDIEREKDKIEPQPFELKEIENRLNEINKLKIKYGRSISDILKAQMKYQEELKALVEIEYEIKQLEEKMSFSIAEYHKIADQVTSLRKEVGNIFEKNIENELKALNMREAQFSIDWKTSRILSAKGVDDIDFVISTNAGLPFESLKKVVSGGELSRIMLAIKVVLGRSEEIPILIFDEIDAGISGNTANVVGEKLSTLSKISQIICITHLPQIAVFADQHFLIEKDTENHTTKTRVTKIDDKSIINEIGRLVGGVEDAESTYIHAQQMIESAHSKKKI